MFPNMRGGMVFVVFALVLLRFEEGDASPVPVPPEEARWSARAIDRATGLPVVGVTLEVTERYTLWRCSEHPGNLCANCYTTELTRTASDITETDGAVEIVFDHSLCEQVSSDPPLWESSIHLRFETPRLIEVQTSTTSTPWVLAYIANGPSPYDQTLYLEHESVLASRFAPVLHRHGGLERQLDLGNCGATIDQYALFAAYNVLGQRVAGDFDPPPTHVWDSSNGLWDSFGRHSANPIFWRMDLADAAWNLGAPAGQRPLYYHVFPEDDHVIVQYWAWWNSNDLSEPYDPEEVAALHEGDWECVALQVSWYNGDWFPGWVDLSQHEGGMAWGQAQCFWSPTSEPTYDGLALGYDTSRPHPHVWVASNSHALYNRFEATYDLAISVPSFCHGRLRDRADYGLADQSNGAHRFFEYDFLQPMGEYFAAESAHGKDWLYHLEGAPLDFLKFTGRFGEGFCVTPDQCAITCTAFPYQFYTLAPWSPINGNGSQIWRGFITGNGDRYGNEDGDAWQVSWAETPHDREYLGEFRHVGGTSGDTIRFSVGTHWEFPGAPGYAEVRRIAGDARLVVAGSGGVIPVVRQGVQYKFEDVVQDGSGTFEIDLFGELNNTRYYVAHELRLDVAQDPGGTTGLAEPDAAHTEERFDITPNPSDGISTVRFEHPPAGVTRLTIHDAAGALIRSAELAPESSAWTWDGRRENGARAPAGIYFVRANTAGRSLRGPRLLILRGHD